MGDKNQVLNYKILFLGDSTVGKTCFFLRINENIFMGSHLSTIGTDTNKKDVEVIDKATGKPVTLKMVLTDSAGQERFRAITKSYFRQADGIFLMYDVTKRETFNNVANWLVQIKEKAPEYVIIYLVANKIDLYNSTPPEKRVSKEEGINFAKRNNLIFSEISCKENENTLKTFQNISSDIYEKQKTINTNNGGVSLTLKKKSRGCC